MSVPVTIVDYGLGNLHSVVNALTFLGATVSVAEDGAALAEAHHVILPGVGAFRDGMEGLRQRGHVEALRAHASAGKPLLGICLGAQLLLSESEEYGTTAGLDLIPGRVVGIPAAEVKVPLVGWRQLLSPRGTFSGLLADLPKGACMYFVHSYHCVPNDPAALLSTVAHGPHTVHAAVSAGSVTGLQFHPEKSGADGMQILSRFLQS